MMNSKSENYIQRIRESGLDFSSTKHFLSKELDELKSFVDTHNAEVEEGLFNNLLTVDSEQLRYETYLNELVAKLEEIRVRSDAHKLALKISSDLRKEDAPWDLPSPFMIELKKILSFPFKKNSA